MTPNKTARKQKVYQKKKNSLLQANATKFSLFKQLNCFNDEGFLKVMSLRFIAYNNNKNELFSLKSENFAEFILQQRILNSG